MINWIQGALAVGKEVLRLVLRRPVLGILCVPVDEGGRVVMMRRRDTGTWCLPGGAVEWGERLSEAISRELFEETGYSLVEVGRVIALYSDPARDPRMHSICVLVEARVRAGGAADLNPLETIEVSAFSLDELPEELAFDTAKMIEDWKRGGAARLD